MLEILKPYRSNMDGDRKVYGAGADVKFVVCLAPDLCEGF